MLFIESVVTQSNFILFDHIRSRVSINMTKTSISPRKVDRRMVAGAAKAPTSLKRRSTEPILASSESNRKRRRIAGPQPGSLCGVMRKHAGLSLYVMPICWTDTHADLLNAKWTELPSSTTPIPSPTNKTQLRQPPGPVNALTAELTTLLSREVTRPLIKLRALKEVMNFFFPNSLCRPRSAADLDIHFGARTIKKAIRLQLSWKSPDAPTNLSSFDSAATLTGSIDGPGSQHNSQVPSPPSSQLLPDPVLAYMSRSQLAAIRQHLFRIVPHPTDITNVPVSQLQKLRCKMLVPADLDKDAHFVAIFLAMAQQQLYGPPGSNPSSQSSQGSSSSAHSNKTKPAFRDVHVKLLTHDDAAAEFIVYTAVVSAGLLKKFHSPYRVPDGALSTDGMDILYTRVPIWPVLGLKERLGKALGREIAGDIGEDDFETWGMAVTPKSITTTATNGSNGSSSQPARPSSQYSPSQYSQSSQASSRTPSPPARGVKRPREALVELLNRSFEEKTKHLPASTLAAASLTAALKSPGRPRDRNPSPTVASAAASSSSVLSTSLGLSSTASVGKASPAKRRRISEPTRSLGRGSASEVDVAV